MRFLQVQKDGTITDCITFPHGDYIPFEGEVPQDILGGWYKLIDGKIVEFPELRPINKEQEIEELKKKQEIMQKAIDDLMLGGAL